MAYKSIPAITIAGEPMTPSDDPGKEAIDISGAAPGIAPTSSRLRTRNQPIRIARKNPARNSEK